MKLFGCAECRTTFNDWGEHIKTKKHIRLMNKSMYGPEVFNSHLVSKIVFTWPLIPKAPWSKDISWRTVYAGTKPTTKVIK